MSKIGKMPITIPESVKYSQDAGVVSISGPIGQLSLNLPAKIKVEKVKDQIMVYPLTADKKTKSNHGTIRALISNMVEGVQTPWVKNLEIRGTGYKAIVSANKVTLSLGFIHPVEVNIPEGITVEVDAETKLKISGADKTAVGQLASNIRKIRKPEPYQGKGVRYADEYIKIKPGKAAKTDS
jgi:large subunit ribosomal protein L6